MLSEYVGQEKAVETLKIAIEAALKRGESLEHILLNRPPGLGKTTLAHIIANEMNTKIVTSSGPALEKGGDPDGLLTNMEKGDIFIQTRYTGYRRSSKNFSTWLMEDFAVDFILTGASMPVRTGIGLSASP